MQRWILPLVLVIVASFAAWQAVETDESLAEAALDTDGESAPALNTPLISIRRTPEFLREPILIQNLQVSLEELTEQFPTQSCLVVSVDGEEVFADNATLPLVPASAQKILTAYGVYELLDIEHTYETSVVSDIPVVDGIIDGNIYLVGGGDPLLATADYAGRYEQQPHFRTNIEQLADSLVASGITEINGAVLGDETRYDTERYVPEWPERFTNAAQNQTGPLSALTVNDGFTQFDPNPAPSLATATTEPAVFAASFFDDLLEERGVIIRQSAGAAEAPAGARTLASITSDPIAIATNQMVEISDNMAAELLLKEVGLVSSGQGTTDDGALAIENSLRAAGFSVAETDFVDGSGLASENRVTCRLLVEVLEATSGGPLHDGLAIAGETGTLRERMVDTPAEGKIRAKTGRLNEVGALAGTAEASDGSVLTFAWLANTTDLYPVEDMTDTQDAVALELVAFPEGPDVEALGPRR